MEDFRKTISSLKRGRAAKVCPNCGSTDISPLTMTGYITQPTYVCNNCGFQSTIFPELDLKELRGKSQLKAIGGDADGEREDEAQTEEGAEWDERE